jgi:hypothetical protein
MVLSQLLLLLGTAASFLTSPSDAVDASSGKRHFNNIQPLSSDIIDTQVALVRAQLPPDIFFSISRHDTQPPSSDVSSFTRISTEVERVVGCILPPPLPPNTDDCGFLIHSMGRVSSYTPPHVMGASNTNIDHAFSSTAQVRARWKASSMENGILVWCKS